MVKLSIGMMVKNEERWLERCLTSLLPVLEALDSELIIVDTGSEDRTIEIARRFTDRVYSHPWQDDFAHMRNVVLGYARGEWFWSIDADEILETPKPVIDFLTSPESRKYNSATVRIKNVTDENNMQHLPTAVVPRLFRREPGFCYRGAIHEQPAYRGPIFHTNATFLHYGYLATDHDLMERKFRRTASLLKRELEKDPKNLYYWYQLSQSYAMHKDFDDAVEPIMRAYDLVKQKGQQRRLYPYVYGQLVLLHSQLGRFRQVVRFAEEALTLWRDYPDFHFFRAKAYAAMGELTAAADAYLQYLECIREFDSSEASRDTSYPHYTLYRVDEAHRDLVSIHYRLRKFKEAGDWALKVEKVDALEPVLDQVIESLIKGQRLEELRDLCCRLEDEHSGLAERFRTLLEAYRLKVDTDVDRQLSEMLSSKDNEYGALNMARLNYNREDGLERIALCFKDWNWAKAPSYYGDLFYTLVFRKRLLDWQAATSINGKLLTELLTFAQRRLPEAPTVVAQYLLEIEGLNTLAELRTAKDLALYAMLHHEWSENEYERLFGRYIEWGVSYLEHLYRDEVLESVLTDEVKNSEEAALMLVRKAKLCSKSPRQQLKYLREAAQQFTPIAKGIALYLRRLEERLSNDEFARNAAKVKQNIQTLIEAGHLEEAQTILSQYASLVPDDPAIYSISSAIKVASGDLDGAHQILTEAVSLHPDDFDIWFNLAYVSFAKNLTVEAEEALRRAESLARESDQLEDLRCLREQIAAPAS